MFVDGFVHQLPDTDPDETTEWLDSLDAVIDGRGKARARYLLARLMARANEHGVGVPSMTSTPYINTIPPEQEPWFPGDEHIERRIRAFVRWNAVAMVDRANHRYDGLGGHLSTYASAAALYEVGFNHFFRGKSNGDFGDQVYFQGHAAPGIYARAFLEGRLTEEHLDGFRREVSATLGIPSYPHPRRMPDFWEFPTVSMGLGPLNAVAQARFNRYLLHHEIADTSDARVWAFVGDGEMDEPESMAGLSIAARENLDNLIFVVNCNLQRLDGPVRGNHKVIQELEMMFRGAGWNVIKVVWGRAWDELLARDVDGVLVNKMNSTVDGEFQKYATESGAYIREHFFGPDPRLQKMVEHLSDEDLERLPRGGHDYRKLYAAYQAAIENEGSPTVILAKTVKGWTLGSSFEARNATHQIKKLTVEELKRFRDRLYLEIPDSDLEDDVAPYYHPGIDSPEYEYMMSRRQMLDGSIPERVVGRSRSTSRGPRSTRSCSRDGGEAAGVDDDRVRRGWPASCSPTRRSGTAVVPIIPDEARTFGLNALFRDVKIYSPIGQRYEPVDAGLLLSYREAKNGRILEEGITEAGSMASMTAVGTAYATWGQPMIPFLIFYSMFGFQRVGDLVWSFGDQRGRGFMLRHDRRTHDAHRRRSPALLTGRATSSQRRCRTVWAIGVAFGHQRYVVHARRDPWAARRSPAKVSSTATGRATSSTPVPNCHVIHQLRIYEIFEHNKATFHARFRDHAVRIMQRHGFHFGGLWETKRSERTEFVYVLAGRTRRRRTPRGRVRTRSGRRSSARRPPSTATWSAPSRIDSSADGLRASRLVRPA